MTHKTSFIFDLDGTLYQFAPGRNITFGQSVFYADLCKRIDNFFASELKLSPKAAAKVISDLNTEFNGELSLGLERKFGVDRYKYFDATWGCDPKDYITPDPKLSTEMSFFKNNALLLTAAPRTWAQKVLEHLGLSDVFGENIITGDPDIRKPNPQVFSLAAAKLGVHPSKIVSVGDQNETDILPAKSLGMTTLIVGPHKKDADHQAKDIFEAITILKEKL
jgi:putative hydrolase of the HAD superfamily